MSVGKFTKGYLPDTGDRMTVTGPFDPGDDEVHFARVLFLIVQGDGWDAKVVPGMGTWNRRDGGKSEWIGTAQRSGDKDLGPSDGELSPDEIARGIAVSLVVKPGKVLTNRDELERGSARDGETDARFDPPSIEALTWCADFPLARGAPPAGA
jgi:hypothetical protein